MPPCDQYQDQLLDRLYGLLDPAEAAALDAHLAGCPGCAAARDQAGRWAGLIARAAQGEFPGVRFVPPEEAAAPAAAGAAADSFALPPQNTVARWTAWAAVAAGLLLAAAGVGGPAARDLIGFARYKPRVDEETALLRQADAKRQRLADAVRDADRRAAERLAKAQTEHDQLLAEWKGKEEQVVAAARERPLTVDLNGPATALPGAPNRYTVRVLDTKTGKSRPAAVEAQVKDAAGRTLFARKFDTDGKEADERGQPRANLTLPASLWAGVPPGAELFLVLTATDREKGAQAELTEKFRLLEPVYTTFLTTDKPMYRPGETVYFRSLTLDRARLLPPDRELNLTFKLYGPGGKEEPGLRLSGLATPAAPRSPGATTSEPVRGPDGKPVRGVGTGAFVLPANLAGGEYTLTVKDGRSDEKLATRKIIVNNFKPDGLLKTLEFDARTYGPGDVVQAKVVIRDQGRPLAGAPLGVSVTVGGRPVKPDMAPATTDAAGAAAIRFTLPQSEATGSATLTVTVTRPDKNVETLVRPVPLATQRLHVEFFPEGGDLVAGVPNRVYFRATTDAHPSKPADVSGVLTDGTKTVCEVKTLTDPDHPGVNQGLGVFTFTPEPGKRYAVRLDRPVGVVQPFADRFAAALGAAATVPMSGYELPKAKADGVVLSVPDGVTKPGEPIRVRLWSVGKKRSVLIGAYARGWPLAHRRTTLEPGAMTELALDPGDAKLGGVTRVTVFEEPAGDEGRVSLTPVAERLVFRQQGEVLQLRFDATRPGGQPRGGAFAPGEPVELTVHATDEAGRPRAAILWAAVVNQSVLTMADDKTARLLPTHFLLSGEVQRGDELEHADFLLTDHPKAAAGLDLLLGTQGWRRFAEQAPEEFRTRYQGRPEAVVVAMGGAAGVPPGWRSDVRRVFDEYWPRYEAAVAELDAAEQEQRTGAAAAGLRADLTRAEGEFNARLAAFGRVVPELEYFDRSARSRRPWLPVTLAVTLGLGLVLLVVRFTRKPGSPERRPLAVGAVGFLAVGLFALLAAWLTGRSDPGWRHYAAMAPRPAGGGIFSPVPAPPAAPALPKAADAGGPERLMPPGGMEKGSPPGVVRKFGGGEIKELGPRVAVQMPEDNALAERLAFNKVGRGPRRDAVFDKLPEPASPGERLRKDLGAIRQRAMMARQPLDEVAELALARMEAAAPRFAPLVVREYAHARPADAPADRPRDDFTETLLWKPVLVLPDDGTATLKFDLSDAVAPYQVLVAGHTLDGRIGAVTGTIEVRKPLAADPKLPVEVGSADKIDLPVGLTNGTNDPHTAGVALTLDGLAAAGGDKFSVKLPPNGGGRRVVRLTPTRPEGELAVTVAATAGPGLADSVRRTAKVVPDGFPHRGSKSDLLEGRVEAAVTLPERWAPGTLKVEVTAYPNTLAELTAGLDGLMREPHGCFEQSSTANYPNVLIAEYLRETGRADPDLARRSRELMEKGYTRLTGYECPKTGSPVRLGYEWFGAPDRPHEALTAYGLMQFTDMARVYPVDPTMLARTRQFLIDSRDGKGGFKRNARALDSFGRAPEHVTDAYIVWAVTEADRTAAEPADLTREIDALLAQAKDGEPAKDPYFLSLLANALLNRGRQAEGVAVLKTVAGMQAADGSVPGARTSITCSSGRALLIETTALAVLGWQKANRPDQFLGNVERAMRWVGGQRDGSGAFGSTQATILALKALIAHAKANGPGADSGALRVLVGGEVVATREFSAASVGPVVVELPDAEKRFRPGRTVVRLETTAKRPCPVSVAWECRTPRPESDPDCGVRLEATLARPEVEEGESVRLAVTVQNVTDTPHGMAVAIVGLPAGLKLPEDAKQLKDLTAARDGAEPTVSYWETRGRELILYWRGLAPRQKLSLGLDLIAAVPGEYRGPASRAYLYYDADRKHWVEPLAVTVRMKPAAEPTASR